MTKERLLRLEAMLDEYLDWRLGADDEVTSPIVWDSCEILRADISMEIARAKS